MKKTQALKNLSTEELGKLFPIEVVPYDKNWKNKFENEKILVQKKLGENALKIDHFGSTAVEGLSAKPIVDILIEIPALNEELKTEFIQKMSEIGYQFIWRTDEEIPYMNFVKGYTESGFQGEVFHVHCGERNHPLWDRIYFRDYLKQHPEVAKEYENLKIELAKKHQFNREDYTNAKSEFIHKITAVAKNMK